MNNLKRYYNQNRKKIWGIIIIIAFVLLLIQLANGYVSRSNERRIEQARIQLEKSKENTQTTEQENSSSTTRTQKETKSENISTIEQFLNFCNNKELDKAYEMVTDDCKKQMFNDLGTFEKIYYNSAFENRKKEFSIEKWSNNTYMVKINENSLALGKTATEDNQKIDYITPIKDDNDNYKLNINNYIRYEEINKESTQDGIKYEVIGRNTYMNYEEYILKVTNNTKDEIELDPIDNTRSLYIEDTKETIYPAYKHELTKEMLTVYPGHTDQISIKFYSTYTSNKSIKYIVFGQTKKAGQINEVKIGL